MTDYDYDLVDIEIQDPLDIVDDWWTILVAIVVITMAFYGQYLEDSINELICNGRKWLKEKL